MGFDVNFRLVYMFPVVEVAEGVWSGKIEVHGYQAYPVIFKGIEVCIFPFVEANKLSTHPDIGLLMRVESFFESFVPIAEGLTAEFNSFDGAIFATGRDIDIQAGIDWQAVLDRLLNNL